MLLKWVYHKTIKNANFYIKKIEVFQKTMDIGMRKGIKSITEVSTSRNLKKKSKINPKHAEGRQYQRKEINRNRNWK